VWPVRPAAQILSSHKLIEIQCVQCHSTRRMKHLDFHVRYASVQLKWNDAGFVTDVRVLPCFGALAPETFQPEWIPYRVFRLVEDLKDYFERGTPLSRTSFDDLDIESWTDFQRKVYEATFQIPHGETRTYGWVAQKIGKALACRAVGQALRNNPVPLLVPCHRVVSHQSLGGFMGEDDPDAPLIALKKRLLSLEHDFRNPVFSFSDHSSFDPQAQGKLA
jgi:O-6-methylguanine DNA methyltransferase